MPRWVNVVRRDNAPSSGDDSPTSIVRLDDIPTSHVQVVTSPPPAPPQSWIRRMAPWAVFGVVAVVVVGGTTAWSASVRGPEKPLLASVPSTYAAVPQATTDAPPPAEPTAKPEPETERAAVVATKVRRPAPPSPTPQQPAPPPPPPPVTTTAAPPQTTASQTPRITTTPRTTTRRPPLFQTQPRTTTPRPGAGTSGTR
ncbi:hypothetical protein ACQPZQ_11695 [Pseudonocardia sp. CA-142604]|uniref:hypothetical protein n=1 Tax=Pseudonocardia sp. CA-142604 TaxID=3240024 RepID=UPI003D8C8A31